MSEKEYSRRDTAEAEASKSFLIQMSPNARSLQHSNIARYFRRFPRINSGGFLLTVTGIKVVQRTVLSRRPADDHAIQQLNFENPGGLANPVGQPVLVQRLLPGILAFVPLLLTTGSKLR
jgi:hypothetical protein